MIRPVLFQLHWFFGITAGTILAIMGITGASIAFQDEILRAMNAPLANIAMQHHAGDEVLPLATLVDRVAGPDARSVERVTVDATGQHVSAIRLGGRDKRQVYVDPYSGQVLGEPKGQAVFDFLEDVHRHLTVGDTGRVITGVCVIILLFFCLSGLYLRWPRRWRSPRAWLAIEWKRSGRSFLWSLHSVFGTWVLVIYLLIALTGLWWSFGWYRDGLTSLLGGSTQKPAAVAKGAPRPDFARLQKSLEAVEPELRRGWMDLRMGRGGQLTARFRTDDAAHDRAFDSIEFDGVTGEVARVERYAEMPLGRKLLASIYALHTGSFFGLPGRIVNMAAAAGMSVFFVTGWMLYLDRRRKKRDVRASRVMLAPVTSDPWRVFFASQSGTAERLAWHAAGHLQSSGVAVEVHPIARLDKAMLASTRRALFVVSTFGDGEPPDAARLFERRMMSSAVSLSHMSYAMLGLGDRQYAAFCGFSRRVRAWMDTRGASPLVDPVELDRLDEEGLGRWHESLGIATGIVPLEPIETEVPAVAWRLASRVALNPSSHSAGMFRVSLERPAGVTWRAGDILEVAVGHGGDHAGPWREYSIASIATDGVADLVIRLVTFDDGTHGLGSGWLCVQARPGDTVYARVRTNPGFHRVQGPAPMILIGAGTGIAGLRSLVHEAMAGGEGGHWLLYGERTREHDHAFAPEMADWLRRGVLARVDTTFSRDHPTRHYVQHRLTEHADVLREWIARGATIYVCGSLVGMGTDVDATLRAILGDDRVEVLAACGQYRRDVY